MRPRPAIRNVLLVVLLSVAMAHSVQAAQTATVSGTPKLHSGPGAEFAPTGQTLPAGATVTLERCSTDLLTGNDAAGLIQAAPGAGAWCLVRGAGWVEASGLVNIAADPQDLLPDGTGFDPLDPLKDSTPAWDDPTGGADEVLP